MLAAPRRGRRRRSALAVHIIRVLGIQDPLPDDVRHIKKTVLFKTDIDEGRPDAGNDGTDLAFKDGPHQLFVRLPLDVILFQVPVFHHGDLGGLKFHIH